MNVVAVLCPHPPLLFRELGGAHDPVVELREACASAVAGLVGEEPDVVVVLGGADSHGSFDQAALPDVRGFGTTAPREAAAERLPLSLGVGRRLLDEAGWAGPTGLVALPWLASTADLEAALDGVLGAGDPDRRVGLLLLGDGSARRGEKAPGFLDPRAFPFDDDLARALAGGDGAALRDLDVELADELMVGGVAAFRALGHLAALAGQPERAELTYRDDPFGVSYFVARWDFADLSASR